MSQFVAVVTPGYQWQDGELWTASKANLAAEPTVNFNYTGGGTLTLGPGAVGISNLSAGMFTANATGRVPFVNGWLSLPLIGNAIFTADAYGRAPFVNGWLTANLVAANTFTADIYGRPQFASGWLTATVVQPDKYWYAVGTGTGAAVTAAFSPALNTYTNPTLAAYWDGMLISIRLPATLALGATLNAGLGAVAIYAQNGVAVVAGAAVLGQTVDFRYNSTLGGGAGGWQMMSSPVAPWTRAGTFAYTGAGMTVTFSSATPGGTVSYVVMLTPTSAAGGSNYAQSAYASVLTTNGFNVTGYATLSAGQTYAYLAMPTN